MAVRYEKDKKNEKISIVDNKKKQKRQIPTTRPGLGLK